MENFWVEKARWGGRVGVSQQADAVSTRGWEGGVMRGTDVLSPPGWGVPPGWSRLIPSAHTHPAQQRGAFISLSLKGKRLHILGGAMQLFCVGNLD